MSRTRFACLLAAALTALCAQDYRISGTVVNGLTGQALPRAHVSIACQQRRHEAITGSDGGFSFSGLTACNWLLRAERNGFLGRAYGQRPVFNALGSAVVTGGEVPTEGLAMRLYPSAVVKGRVTDENGEPVQGALVQLIASAVDQGRRRARPVGYEWTNDRGEYRFWQLPSSSYYVGATGAPWTSRHLFGADEAANANTFEPQYYRNAPDARSAVPLKLRPGEEATADFALRPSRGVRVSVAGPQPQEQVELTSQGMQGCSLIHQMGRAFTGVLPGRYTVVVNGAVGRRTQEIEVGTTDMTVTLAPFEPATVSATVRAFGGNPESIRKTQIALQDEDEMTLRRRMAVPDARIPYGKVAPGRYRIMAFGDEEIYLKSVAAEGAKIANGLIELPERSAVNLDIILGADGGRVKGKVYAGGRPCEGALVILAPRADPNDPRPPAVYQTELDGSFDYKSVKPGDYVVFATLDMDIEYANPAAIRAYLSAGQGIRVDPKGIYDLKLEPLKP